jgi:hypothetical protein
MTLDFYNPLCSTKNIVNDSFGLCDHVIGQPASPDFDTVLKPNWIAEVQNKKGFSVTFHAIDKCILQDTDLPDQPRCDVMLTTDQHLYFVELKNSPHTKRKDALEQLKNTILLYASFHSDKLKMYRHKKAFYCNKKSKKFHVISQEESKEFRERTGFRLDIQGSIVIV